MHVLIMDDDASSAQSVESLLKAEKFSVFATGRGEEGVELAKLYDYDVILLGLNLPDMSCHEAARALRAARVRTPVLILSDFAGIGDTLKMLGFGADDCLGGPVGEGDLVARLQAAAQRPQAAAQRLETAAQRPQAAAPAAIDGAALLAHVRRTHLETRGLGLDPTDADHPLLALLMQYKGATLTEDMIYDVFVGALRQKLAEACPCEEAAAPRRDLTA